MIVFRITITFLFSIAWTTTFQSNSSLCYSHDNNEAYHFGGRCYIYYDNKLNFENAREHCKTHFSNTSDLVSIENQNINDFVNSLKSDSNEDAWIGFKTVNRFDWFWVHNESYSVSMQGGYTNWDQFQPDIVSLCASMLGVDGKWNNDVYCPTNIGFFCQYDVPECFDVSATDYTNVCSGNGLCTFQDNCECIEGCAMGNNCEEIFCSGISILQNDSDICSGKGECYSCNKCICTEDNTYGYNCEERISDFGIANFSSAEIQIFYEVGLELVPSQYIGNDTTSAKLFDCGLIISESDVDIGRTFCHFEVDKNMTQLLVISNFTSNKTETLGKELHLSTITGYHEFVVVVLVAEPIEFESDSEIDSETVLTEDDEIETQNFFGIEFIIVVSIIIGLCSIILACIIIFIISVCIFAIKQWRMNKLFSKHEFDEFDFLDRQDELENVAKFKVRSDLFKIDYDELDVKKKLGHGTFGMVYCAMWNGKKVAFKCFQTHDLAGEEENFEEFEKEINVISSISHPNIVTWYGCTIKPPRVGLVIEFCENGDMKDYMTKNPEVNVIIRMKFISGIISAMSFLHSRNIIHRDLKSENVLIADNLEPKLADFGISKIINPRSNNEKTQYVGTSYYMAPEVCTSVDYSEKCDVFSFGIMLYEIVTSNFKPFGTTKMFGIETKIAQDETFRPDTTKVSIGSKTLTSGLVGMMKRCWKHDPQERPDFKDLIESVYETSTKQK